MPRAVLLTFLLLAACTGGTPTRPTPPPPAEPPAVPGPALVTQIAGQVTATVTGEPQRDITIDIGGLNTTTDATGTFVVEWPTGTHSYFPQVTLTGPQIVRRQFTVSATESRHLAIDVISLGHGFDLEYYRRLVRRAVEQPDAPEPLRRWTRPPRVYLKTIDEQGQPIDAETLREAERALADDAAAWTGGRFGLAEIVRGVETREGLSEWITVKWPSPATPGICGRAQVALEGGWIELNYLNPLCGCGTSRISAGVVRHEIGHALGFFHTDEPSDLMSSRIASALWCDGRASARERFHAAIAYSRPVGNRDPDTDPGSTIRHAPREPIVVID